ncbi:hypothetical protein J4E85_006202 [Alternaria conjuncta]|uniref:uncharacterized protein n=1 Tax=Alternaria conjuncta TaxID=181017 RepID=UPI00221F7F8B|nr:uncharacterized protein J4E85_006202 [Alternaria conjuncta]KAI4927690.1 hypothetical protein J4E85_006202 [Alternaria conjuncta]
MTVSKTRGAARKGAHKRVHFGRHMVDIFVGPDEHPFSVHQDLLCSSSSYFKEEVQSSRKVIEGECSICTEGMSGHLPITYCGPCGQNFHTGCIQEWLDREEICPLCRTEWNYFEDEVGICETSLEECDPLSFDMYMQWLYTGTIPVYPHGDLENAVQNRFIELMKAHIVGDKLQDPGFLKAIYEEIIDYSLTVEKLPSRKSVVFAYTNGSEVSLLRKFLAALYAVRASSHFKDLERFPKQFI